MGEANFDRPTVNDLPVQGQNLALSPGRVVGEASDLLADLRETPRRSSANSSGRGSQFLLPGPFGYSLPGRLPRVAASEPGDDAVPIGVERQGHRHHDGREENHVEIVAGCRLGALS